MHRSLTIGTTRLPAIFGPLLGLVALLLFLPSSASSIDPGERPVILSITFGGLHFVNDDMNDTYGMTPAVGLRLAKQMDERAELFIGLQYAKDSGRPFDTPDFRSQKETELKLAPITFGARLNATNNPHRLFYFGLALRYLWMSEKGPWGSTWNDPGEPKYSGWGWGLRFLIGPEWRDPAGRIALGLEASFGPQAAVVKRGYSDRDVDLSGTDVRFYLSGLF